MSVFAQLQGKHILSNYVLREKKIQSSCVYISKNTVILKIYTLDQVFRCLSQIIKPTNFVVSSKKNWGISAFLCGTYLLLEN